MPFGNQSEAYKKENNIYLTVEQALADYVQFLKHYLIEGNTNLVFSSNLYKS